MTTDRYSNELAINGGIPIRDTMLPYGQQWIDEEDIDAVISVLKSDFITQGPQISKFERAIAEYVDATFAVAFSNGTAALHAACFAAGIGAGDEVITTPITFLASSNSVLYQGGTPLFADIRNDTYNIDPRSIEKWITPKTKAIIPVDFTGQPVEIDAINIVAEKYHLTVIQDAAHSLGAEYDGRKVGSLADMTMFSFHPVKHITSGEGGIITTNDENYYKRLQLFRNHGMTKEPSDLLKNEGPWYYEMHALGYNYRMTDLQAALGNSQFRKLDKFVDRRKQIASIYNQAFEELYGVTCPYQHEKANSSWHLYVLRFDLTKFAVNRKVLFDALRAENIGVHVHYIPVYLQPYYQQLRYEKGTCPVAEHFYEEIITLPLFPKMVDRDVEDVINAVKKVCRAYYVEK